MTLIAAQFRLATQLGRRFARSRALAKSTSIVFVAALFAMAMFITLGTLSLSGEQVADRDLGRFDSSAGYGSVVLPPGEDEFSDELHARVRATGVADALVVLSATDVQLTTAPVREVTMLETAWLSQPYPDRFVLLSGRWPSRPGEVVVADPTDVAASAGTVLPVLGGGAELRVVGTADDRFSRTSHLLAAPGTWAGLDPALADAFQALGAQPFLLWSGGATDAVVAEFTATVRDWGRRQEAGTDLADPEVVAGTVTTREQLSERPQRTWIERSPAGYTVPSLLVPVGAVLLVFGLNDRRFQRIVTSMVALGVRRTTAAAGLGVAVLSWCLIATASGVLGGVAVGIGARAVIAHLRDQPPGPVAGLAMPLLRLLLLVALTVLVAAVVLARSRPGNIHPEAPRTTRASGGKAVRDARHLLAVAAWCVAAIYAVGVDSPPKAMVLTGIVIAATVLIVPEVLGGILKLLPDKGPRQRLARRQLSADPLRAGTALAAVTVLLGASLSYLALLDTLIRTADHQAYPDVLPGQVLVTDRASSIFAPPASVLRAAQSTDALDGSHGFELTHLVIAVDDADLVTRSITREETHKILLAVGNPGEAERLVAHSLDEAQRSTLLDGGVLIWADADGVDPGAPLPARLVLREGDEIVSRTSELPAATVNVGLADWRIGTDGVLLRQTVAQLGLPLPPDGPVMFTGLSSSESRAVQAAVTAAGVDARTVRIYVPPPPAVPPAALLATAAGLVILVLIAVSAASRGQARTLRGYLARLIAVGLPTTWARQVLLYQLGVLVAASTVLGLVIALIPTTVLAFRVSGFVLSIPWGQLATLLAAIYLAAGLGALLHIRNLRAREGILPGSV